MAKRRPASPHELETAEAVIKLSYLTQIIIADVAASQGFSNNQVRALAILRDRSLTMGELGRVLALEKSSLTILVDRAVDAGLMQRASSKRDRRAVEVTLTAKGRSLDALMRAAITTRVIAMFDASMTSTQRAQCTQLIRAIVDPLLPEPV